MFGPIRRMPYLRAMATISPWPSTFPVSAKPEGMRTAPGMCFSPTSTRAWATNFAGIAKTEISTLPGTSFLVGLQTHELPGLRVDRVDRSLVPAVDQVLHDRVADLAVLRGGANHR